MSIQRHDTPDKGTWPVTETFVVARRRPLMTLCHDRNSEAARVFWPRGAGHPDVDGRVCRSRQRSGLDSKVAACATA